MRTVKVILKIDLVNVLLGFSRDPYYEPTIVVHDIRTYSGLSYLVY